MVICLHWDSQSSPAGVFTDLRRWKMYTYISDMVVLFVIFASHCLILSKFWISYLGNIPDSGNSFRREHIVPLKRTSQSVSLHLKNFIRKKIHHIAKDIKQATLWKPSSGPLPAKITIKLKQYILLSRMMWSSKDFVEIITLTIALWYRTSGG